MIKKFILFLALLLPLFAFSDPIGMKNSDLVLKISVLSTNKVLLNGEEVGPDQLALELAKAKTKQGAVWYYRENAAGEPPPASMQVIQMVIDNKLPISMSTKPDFSDYVDENGNSAPR